MNYCGIIATISKVEPIPNADRIQVAFVLGERVIVSKELEVGFKGILFPVGTQLSAEYMSTNNLYRDSSLNANKDAKGFFESNGRVRAQPFLGVKSEGYFAGLESVAYTGADVQSLDTGTMFQELNGYHIANRYEVVKKQNGTSNKVKQRKKIEAPLFHEHVDTDQFKYHAGNIPVGSLISIQAKAHGTSGRASYTLVRRQLPWWKRLVNKLLPMFSEESWEYVTGTRRVLLKNEDNGKDGFHGSESFRFEILETLRPFLDKGMTAYYEIIGYANGKAIMPQHSTKALKDKSYTEKYGDTVGYSYGCQPDEYRFFIYRLTYTSLGGVEIDFTQPQLVAWCNDRGLTPSLDIVTPFVYKGNVEALRKLVDDLTERHDLLTQDYRNPTQISEGVIVRVDCDRLVPRFYKNKSYAFKVLEGIAHENGVVDMEESNS